MAAYRVLFLLSAALALAGCEEAQGTDWIAETEAAFNNVKSHIEGMLNKGQGPKELVETIQVEVQSLATQLQADFNKLQKQVEDNPDVAKLVTTLKTKVEEAVGGLKEQNPELAASAEGLHEKVVKSMEGIVQEVRKVEAEASKEGGLKDQLDTLLKNFVQQGQEHYKTLEKTIHDAVGHKHEHA